MKILNFAARAPSIRLLWQATLLFLLFLIHADARKHHLVVPNDTRPYIALSTFGFYINGLLEVKLNKFTIDNENENDVFGLSLDKTTIDQMNPYLDSHQNRCILEEPSVMQRSGPILFFRFDLKNQVVRVQCSPEWKNLHIFRERPRILQKFSESSMFGQLRRRRETEPRDEEDNIMPNEPAIDDDSYEAPQLKDAKPTESAVEPSKPIEHAAQSIEPAAKPIEHAAKPIEPAAKPIEAVAKPSQNESKKSNDMAANSQEATKPPPPPVASKNDNDMAEAIPEPNVVPQKEDESQDNSIFPHEDVNPIFSTNENMQICSGTTWPLLKTVVNGVNYYNMSFFMLVTTLVDEGLYNLYFHACPNYFNPKRVSFNVDIEEKNDSNYLSAGEMPLPALYFMMSILFFLSGLFWVFILRKSKDNVFKIHYIMAILVFLKSLSLLFHAINFHFIEIQGEHVEAWAILYYITHLLKGAVLFITIVLIGTGWTFIKHILSDKDKKIFMIVIPLQVLANIAEIVIDESEESDVEFRTWRNIFIFVDLLCCGAILFPIVWSIRHLHEASATDGKAAINLRKLKLFRQFYIMIVCYIYFTRIIVYLLKMTVAFQYAWLDEMFHEMATYVFFVLTGYKFRPASSHPYFTVPEEDDCEVEVLTESGLTQGLHRTKALNRNAPPRTTTVVIEGNDEEREILLSKRESSHEYD